MAVGTAYIYCLPQVTHLHLWGRGGVKETVYTCTTDRKQTWFHFSLQLLHWRCQGVLCSVSGSHFRCSTVQYDHLHSNHHSSDQAHQKQTRKDGQRCQSTEEIKHTSCHQFVWDHGSLWAHLDPCSLHYQQGLSHLPDPVCSFQLPAGIFHLRFLLCSQFGCTSVVAGEVDVWMLCPR